MRHDHSGSVTIIHKLDPEQFAQILHFATALLGILGSTESPEEIRAITAKMKASADALHAVVEQNPTP